MVLSTGNTIQKLGEKRFLCSQAIALAMKGIPAVYFHSLCGTIIFRKGLSRLGKIELLIAEMEKDELETLLNDEKVIREQYLNGIPGYCADDLPAPLSS